MNLLIHWGSKIILVQNTTITRKKKTKKSWLKQKTSWPKLREIQINLKLREICNRTRLRWWRVWFFFFVIFKSVFIMKKYFFIDFKVLISKIKIWKKNILIYFLKNILYHIIKYENLRLHKINKNLGLRTIWRDVQIWLNVF